MDSLKMPLVAVQRCEEEWRTSGRRSVGHHGRRSHGRVCLWLHLKCGHAAQRMASLNRTGAYVQPKRVRCDTCRRIGMNPKGDRDG